MFEPAVTAQSTQPDAEGDLAEFRVTHAPERLRLLQELRDRSGHLTLSTREGTSLATMLCEIDTAQQRLHFSVDDRAPHQAPYLTRIVDSGEATGVAYLQSVKLQFDLRGLVLVRAAGVSTLQCALPAEMYRIQRRNAFRVRSQSRSDPVASFRHPSMPEMLLRLHMLDVSIGGCALWLPQDVPTPRTGILLGDVQVQLDNESHFNAPARLQRVSAPEINDMHREKGVRMGCEWQGLPGSAERVLQRWIDRAQQRQRLLSAG